MIRLILASNSPRRRELLSAAGIAFSVVPSKFEEVGAGRSAVGTVRAFAEGKAREVLSRYPEALVLGADTVVCLDGRILGKPGSVEKAKEMLSMLNGRTHEVFTGVCLVGKDVCLKEVARTEVKFRELSGKRIAEYAESGLPLDKAGAYGIQDGFDVVESYQGSYTNVVGLPMELVKAFLKEVHLC